MIHIAVVSPQGSRTSKARTSSFVKALQLAGVRVSVLDERQLSDTASRESAPLSWSRNAAWERDILECLRRLAVDVVHVLYDPEAFGQDSRLPALLRDAQKMGIATAVTLNTVDDSWLFFPGVRLSSKAFHRRLGAVTSRLIARCEADVRKLREQGVEANAIDVIANGPTEALASPKNENRSRGVRGPTVLALGAIHRERGLAMLVEAFASVADQVPGAQLVVAGSLNNSSIDQRYPDKLRDQIRRGVAQGWLRFVSGFQSYAVVVGHVIDADALALPYIYKNDTAMDIVRVALDAGKPVVCGESDNAPGAVQLDSKNGSLIQTPPFATAWTEAILESLHAASEKARLAYLSKEFTHAARWSRIAEQHVEGYCRAIDWQPRVRLAAADTS